MEFYYNLQKKKYRFLNNFLEQLHNTYHVGRDLNNFKCNFYFSVFLLRFYGILWT